MPFPVDLPAEIAADPWQLRLLTDADWNLAWSMSRDPEVVRWTLYPPDMTEDAAHRRSRRITESANRRLSGHYAVLDADHSTIGTAGIASIEGDPAAVEVFYALLPQGRHRGAATAATLALSEWAFSVGVDGVLLLTITGNTASEAVATRAGFVPAGAEIRDHHGSPTRMRRWARSAPNRTA
jgi:RimJ/RimL family protein N-acetyltransferase